MCFILHSGCAFSQSQQIIESKLPGWIGNDYSQDNTCYYALGVSDPFMKKQEAYAQAKMRAASVLSLSSGFHYSKMLDAFYLTTSEKEAYKRNSKIFMLANKFDTLNIEVVKQHYSDYGECILLIRKPKDIAKKDSLYPFNLKVHYFYSEGEAGYSSSHGLIKFNIVEEKSSSVFKYSKYFIAGRKEVISTVKDSVIPFDGNKLKYRLSSEIDKIESVNDYQENMNISFWDAYITSIVKSLAYHFNEKSNSSNAYQSVNGKSKNLNRLLEDDYYNFSIRGMRIKNNNLGISVDISNKK